MEIFLASLKHPDHHNEMFFLGLMVGWLSMLLFIWFTRGMVRRGKVMASTPLQVSSPPPPPPSSTPPVPKIILPE